MTGNAREHPNKTEQAQAATHFCCPAAGQCGKILNIRTTNSIGNVSGFQGMRGGGSSQGSTHLADGTVTNPNDVEERRHDLGQELHALESEGFENKRDGLDYHGVVVGQGLVPEDPHQCYHRDGRVELIQGEVAHVNQHLTGAVIGWEGRRINIKQLRQPKNGRAIRKPDAVEVLSVCYLGGLSKLRLLTNLTG